jgi:hypothetical protein
MKKLKLVVTILCLVSALVFAVPTTAYADGGPQGGSNSAPHPPPPPPIDWARIMMALMHIF